MLGLQHRFAGGGNRIQWRAHDLDRLAKHYGASTSDVSAMIMRYSSDGAADDAAPELVDSSSKIAEATFIISTASVDTYGDTVNQNGWKLSRYRTNPVVLWGHKHSSLPIGKAINTTLDKGRLISTVRFDSDRYAKRVAGMVERGALRTTSVGFMPGEFDFSKDPKRPYGIDFKSGHELLEWSIVCVPANGDCLLVSTSESKSAPMKVDPHEDRRRIVAEARRAL